MDFLSVLHTHEELIPEYALCMGYPLVLLGGDTPYPDSAYPLCFVFGPEEALLAF